MSYTGMRHRLFRGLWTQPSQEDLQDWQADPMTQAEKLRPAEGKKLVGPNQKNGECQADKDSGYIEALYVGWGADARSCPASGENRAGPGRRQGLQEYTVWG